MHTLSCSQIKFGIQDSVDFIHIKSIFSSRCGSSKNALGGWHYVKENPKEIKNFNFVNVEGVVVNIYEEIKQYWDVRQKLGIKGSACDLFFAGTNQHATSFENVFRNKALGKKHIYFLVKIICFANGIVGSDEKSKITCHGLWVHQPEFLLKLEPQILQR